MCLHANCNKQRGVKHVFRFTGKENQQHKCLNERPLPKIPTENPVIFVTECEEEKENDIGTSDDSDEIHKECITERNELEKSIAHKDEELFEVRRVIEQKDENALELKHQLKSITRFCKELELNQKEYDIQKQLIVEKDNDILQLKTVVQNKTIELAKLK
jgi:hypothetical protein